jgi:hypothetical protein
LTPNSRAALPALISPNRSNSITKASCAFRLAFSKNLTLSKYPSVQDFLNLWAALETQKGRTVMRLFAKYGNKGLTSEQLAQYLEVKRASGIMSGINRQSEKVGFDWKRWFPLNNGVYEPDSTAYKNLVEAMALVEAK